MWEQANPKEVAVIPLSFPFLYFYLLLLVVPCAKTGLVPATNQEKKWQLTPVSLPEKYGQRSLVGCNPWARKESGTTERLTFTYLLTYLIKDANGRMLKASQGRGQFWAHANRSLAFL